MRKFFTGATVRTMDPELPLADLVVVDDGVISAVGRRGEVALDPVPGDEVLDMRGLTLLPAFIDAHVHFTQLVWDLSLIDLSRSVTIADVRDTVAEYVENRGTGGWILGRRLPAKIIEEIGESRGKVLEGLASADPVIIGTEDTHSSYLNKRGAGVLTSEGVFNLSRADSESVWCDDGMILREGPSLDAWRWLAEREKILDERTFEAGIERFHAGGVTGIYTFEYLADIPKISKSPVCKRGLRIAAGIYEEDLDSVVTGGRKTLGGEIRIDGLKLYVDGALGSGTAFLLEPYEGKTGRGLNTGTVEELKLPAKSAASRGFGLCLHAIGDAAVRIALDLLQEVSAEADLESAHRRIEHIQLLHPEDEPRFGELGATASVQPTHLVTDRDLVWKAWGDRCRRSYPLRRLFDGGARVVFGSDAPAGPVDPLLAIRVAVTRKIGDEAPGQESWYSGEGIPVRNAVESHTVEGARAMGMGNSIGIIREGYRADMVALSRDPFRSENDLVATEIMATFVGGERVYHR
jgi:predicted amidohydrolase YtcJ